MAAGFALREYSLSGMGSAFAGASAQSDAPGFLSYNPATSSGVEQVDAAFTLNAIYPDSQASYSTAITSFGGPTGGSALPEDFIRDAYEPGFQMRYRLAPDWTAGLSVSAPWGLSTHYNDGWAGRYYAIQSKLITVNIQPTIAYQVTPELTLAGGAQIQYAKGTLSSAIDFGTIGAANAIGFALPGTQDGFVEFNAEDWATGYTLGALWQPTKQFSLGASYRSQIDHDLEGHVAFTLDTAGVGALLVGGSGAFTNTHATTPLSTPAVASLGAAFEVSPGLTLLAEGGYTWWDSFKEIRIIADNPLQPDVFQTYNWKNAWMGAVGAHYQPNETWSFRIGAAFDQSPTTDQTRDPRIPDSDRTWAAFSVGYALSKDWNLELGYGHLFFPEEPINLSSTTPGNEARGSLVGTSDADADVITFQVSFR